MVIRDLGAEICGTLEVGDVGSVCSCGGRSCHSLRECGIAVFGHGAIPRPRQRDEKEKSVSPRKESSLRREAGKEVKDVRIGRVRQPGDRELCSHKARGGAQRNSTRGRSQNHNRHRGTGKLLDLGSS